MFDLLHFRRSDDQDSDTEEQSTDDPTLLSKLTSATTGSSILSLFRLDTNANPSGAEDCPHCARYGDRLPANAQFDHGAERRCLECGYPIQFDVTSEPTTIENRRL